jgi:hypothetical protein
VCVLSATRIGSVVLPMVLLYLVGTRIHLRVIVNAVYLPRLRFRNSVKWGAFRRFRSSVWSQA